MKNNKRQKGFTLIELLVVIAIIAILAVVVVLTLNPAELLRQARDSNRVSDFATMKSALSLYATDVNTSTPMYGTSTLSVNNLSTANASATPLTIATYQTVNTSTSWGFATSTGYVALVINTSRAINGTGWIPVNLSAISSGAPIGSLPIDPTNSGQFMYIYGASSTLFKLTAHMESTKYSTGGSGDVETGDGGNTIYAFEQGSNVTAL